MRAVEVRGRATSTVERARALFDSQPGEALVLLERFTPPHAVVDAALAELRDRFAAREKARQREERSARRQAAVARVTTGAGALARSRIAQAAAAIAVLVLAVVVWRGLSPTPPIDPDTSTSGGTTEVAKGGDDLVDEAAKKKPIDVPVGPTNPDDPPGNKGQIDTPPGNRDRTTPVDPKPRDKTTPTNPDPSEPDPIRTGPKQGDNTGVNPGPGERVPPRDITPPDAVTPKETEPTPKEPEPNRDPVVTRPKDDPPPPPDPVAATRNEIRAWMEAYKAAYRALDANRVRAMNPPARLNAAMFESASVDFSDVRIDVTPDGQNVALNATVRYENVDKRTGKLPPSSARISWRMKKINGVWVANP